MTERDPAAERRKTPAAGESAIQQRARALADPTRYRLFQLVEQATAPVAVAELADALGLHPNAVRQHLAKLTAAGLVHEQTEARHARGRPRLLYTVAPGPGPWSTAPSPYERLSVVLIDAIRSGDAPRTVGRRVGARLAGDLPRREDPVEAIVEAIAREGFDPTVTTRGDVTDIKLQSCPYATAATVDTGVVCELHRGLAEGLAEATGSLEVVDLSVRSPAQGGCRLRLRAPDPGAD